MIFNLSLKSFLICSLLISIQLSCLLCASINGATTTVCTDGIYTCPTLADSNRILCQSNIQQVAIFPGNLTFLQFCCKSCANLQPKCFDLFGSVCSQFSSYCAYSVVANNCNVTCKKC